MIRINEMAMAKSKLQKRLEGQCDEFITHVLKLYLEPDSNAKNHWLKELGGWCREFDSIELKPNNHRPKKEMFLKYFLDDIETVSDTQIEVRSLLKTHIDSEDARDFLCRWKPLREELAKHLSDKDEYSVRFYQDLIKKYMI